MKPVTYQPGLYWWSKDSDGEAVLLPWEIKVTGLARKSDPDTSKEAAAKVDVKKTEYLVLIAIRDSGSQGCIAAELPDLTGLPLNSASARTRPLANKGLIRDSGERRLGPNGRNQIVWKAVL